MTVTQIGYSRGVVVEQQYCITVVVPHVQYLLLLT